MKSFKEFINESIKIIEPKNLQFNLENFKKDFIEYLTKDLKMYKTVYGFYSVEDFDKNFPTEEDIDNNMDIIKLGMIDFYIKIQENKILFKIQCIESDKNGLGSKMLNKIKELIYKYEDFYLKVDNKFVLDIGGNSNIKFWNKFQAENQDLLIIDNKNKKMKNFKEFINESEEEHDYNAVYHKIAKLRNGKIGVVCLQWFDEPDYEHLKWLTDEKFYDTRDLLKYVYQNYELHELDSELTDFKEFKKEYGGDSIYNIMNLVVEKDKITQRLRINKVRKTYAILYEETEKEINNEYKEVYIFTGFEPDLEDFISDYELKNKDYQFEETDYFY